jgi:hypothetical protein
MKYFIYLLASLLLLYGRDNPFKVDIQNNNNNNEFSNIYLQEEKIFLPNNARALESIIIQYRTLDGSKEIKKIQISNAIDWHKPILIKQDSQNVIKNNSFRSVEYIPFKFIKYKITDKSIYIYTKSVKLRHFHLPRPFKIVVDFDSKFRFKTISKQIKRAKVRSITTAAHKGFFRTTILLDAPYKYDIEKLPSGYKINLK